MKIQIHRHQDAATFAERVTPWLLRREAEHNLLLGLLPRLTSSGHAFEAPIYLASVEEGGAVAGCAFRTPPHKLGLTRLPEEALEGLVEDVAAVYQDLSAVLGPEPTAVRFAELWSARKGCPWSLGMRQRIHSLEEVRFPEAASAGSLRCGTVEDLPLLTAWTDGFLGETRIFVGPSRALVDGLVREGGFFLWEEAGEPRAMVAASGWTPHGVRVGYVYTPPQFRGRGYATTLVAAFSQRLLAQGRRFCCLYTDLANPTSNAIYARLGYRPVCDVVDVNFS